MKDPLNDPDVPRLPGEYAFPRDVLDCPYPFYASLRAHAPVYKLRNRRSIWSPTMKL
jgi:hypothetical protein